MSDWTHRDSEELYLVPQWSCGYFAINERGNVEVHPEGTSAEGIPGIDLHQLIRDIHSRGIDPPLLLRFDGILRARVRELAGAFDKARAEFGYRAAYRPVLPIKVNQQRHVVEALLEGGRQHGLGIEVGSKPELLASLALDVGPDALLICNGYKDREYIETALLATKLGMTPIIVIEKFSELETALAASDELGIRPALGVRTKLGGAGSGRWRDSGGLRSKFGLTMRRVVDLIAALRERDMLDCLQLLHYHIGSQITDIRSLKKALQEATRTFVGLHEMGVEIKWFDVGGGLGIDYDGSATTSESSKNYSLQEYANDVVYAIAETCRDADLPEPTILSESGRALTAHHALLVAEVIGVEEVAATDTTLTVGEDEHEKVREIAAVCNDVTARTFHEAYHDATQVRDQALMLFNVGQMSVTDRARIEEIFWATCKRIQQITRKLEYVPEELESLERDLADTYFVNCSVFQSLPDSWAISQLFPIVPLHRHGEEPLRRAVLADITCDSDGKFDRFIDLRDVKQTLELHPLEKGEPYYLGFFLVGAYQESLGDMHNLFGDTNVVHVDRSDSERTRITHVVRGDRVQDVLSYVEYFENDLLASLRRNIERAIEEDRLTSEDSARILRRYVSGLAGYTYLTRDR